MKKILCLWMAISLYGSSFAQTHIDQTGLKTSVTNSLFADGAQASRYEVALVGYNSHHWQFGGLIIVELFSTTFTTGYEKYIIENGYSQGTTGTSPVLKHVESHGGFHSAKITFGEPYNSGTEFGGYPNKVLPIYLDVRYYSAYKVRLTYVQDLVEMVTTLNQIKVNPSPTAVSISDFLVSSIAEVNVETAGNLLISGNGNHYIQNGNLGIGTTTPTEKLSVNGKIRAKEVKVEAANWPDYVFEHDYKLSSLQELEKYIKEYKHMPEIPSAKEIETNGMELGEMNKLLLKKIEELTLHLIDKDKQLDNQQVKLAQLEASFLTLEKKVLAGENKQVNEVKKNEEKVIFNNLIIK